MLNRSKELKFGIYKLCLFSPPWKNKKISRNVAQMSDRERVHQGDRSWLEMMRSGVFLFWPTSCSD